MEVLGSGLRAISSWKGHFHENFLFPPFMSILPTECSSLQGSLLGFFIYNTHLILKSMPYIFYLHFAKTPKLRASCLFLQHWLLPYPLLHLWLYHCCSVVKSEFKLRSSDSKISGISTFLTSLRHFTVDCFDYKGLIDFSAYDLLGH